MAEPLGTRSFACIREPQSNRRQHSETTYVSTYEIASTQAPGN